MIFDLNSYIQSKVSSKAADYEEQTFENPVRFTYMESYLYLNLEEVLYSLYDILHHEKIIYDINEFIATKTNKVEGSNLSPSESLAYCFLRITERLGWTRDYFNQHKCVSTCNLIKYIQSKIKNMITHWPDFIFEANNSQAATLRKHLKNEEKSAMKNNVINKLNAGDIEIVYSRCNGEEKREKPLCYDLPDKKENYKKDDKKDLSKNEREMRERLIMILLRTKKHETDKNLALQNMSSSIFNTVKLSKEFHKYTH